MYMPSFHQALITAGLILLALIKKLIKNPAARLLTRTKRLGSMTGNRL